jgi:glycosyltransferase involved in cell wall biosynthesis
MTVVRNRRSPTPAESVAVAIPTKNRPEKVERCLSALSAVQEISPCPVYVCDSSTSSEARKAVRAICARQSFARYRSHEGETVAAARNACARAVEEHLVVNVDDDIQVEPEAIGRLLEKYFSASGPRVVGGYVAWDGIYKGPVKLRRSGWGEPVGPNEEPDLLVGAFFLYPRALALALPWYEPKRSPQDGWFAEDHMMSVLWRRKGIRLLSEPHARAVHDPERGISQYGLAEESWRIYINLFDALMANPHPPTRALAYELFGFASGAKRFIRQRSAAGPFLRSWIRGHRLLFRDRHILRRLIDTEVPRSIWSFDTDRS